MKQLPLTPEQLVVLLTPVRGQGGFQNLIKKLRGQTVLRLTDDDLKKMHRYARGNGGFQRRMQALLKC